MNLLLRIYPGDWGLLLLANLFVTLTLILLAALALTRFNRRSSAAWRYSVCVVALGSALASPLLSSLIPMQGIAGVPLAPPEVAAPPVEIDRTPAPKDAPVPSAVTVPHAVPSQSGTQAPAGVVPAAESAQVPIGDVLRAIAGIGLLIWLSGIAVLAARWFHGLRVVAAIRQQARWPVNQELRDMLPEVRRALGVEQLPPIAVSSQIDLPVMIGLVRPLVIVPEYALSVLSGPKLTDILVHECAHAVCRHQLGGLLQRAVAMLFWPHPLVHFVNRELAMAREEICDNYVLRLGDAPRYARTLLELSDLLHGATPEPVALGLFQGRWRLEDRIAGLLDHRRKIMIRVNRWKFVALAIPFLLVGGMRFLRAEPAGSEVAEPVLIALAGAAAQDAKGSPAQDAELTQSATNLREIMAAVHTYHNVAGHYPQRHFGWGYDRKANEWFRDRPYLSWRVMLLPLLGQQALFDKFKTSEPWDSDHNKQLIPLMPAVYRAAGSKAAAGKTNYLGVVGTSAVFPDKGTITVPDVVDGTSKTIMLVEVPDSAAVEWTKPTDFPVDDADPLKHLVGLRTGGVLTAFGDGAPQFISSDTPGNVMAMLLRRNDRYPVDDFEKWVRFVEPMAKPAETAK